MSIKPRIRAKGGWTLAEMIVATGVFSISGLALASLFVFGIRSFAAMSNYAILDKANRQAMDKLTAEVREAVKVTAYSNNPPALTIMNPDGVSVTYSFDPNTKRMLRSTSDGTVQTLLTNCSLLNFSLFQRNPSNSFGIYSASNVLVQATGDWMHQVKAVELTWKTSMTISPTANVNSENVQTARVVIRKQQD
jgi:type II secretory pathway component PulJ